MFLPPERDGDTHGTMGLSNLEYAPICEILGRSPIASEAMNCSAPDTGNMEVLARYGTEEQKEKWLKPLLNGEIRSCFAMTEPEVASSDAKNIDCRIERDGNDYVINGRKWWSSGMGDPRCKVLILMGKTDPKAPPYQQQSMIVVPRDAPGIKIVQMLHVFGYDDAPHGHAEVIYDNVRVPKSNILLGEGRGFEIAQGRLGPGRIHHCMRSIGVAERALEMAIKRAKSRVAFGQRLSEMGVTKAHVADMRMEIDRPACWCCKAAWMMDKVGNKVARKQIAMIKVVVPNITRRSSTAACRSMAAAASARCSRWPACTPISAPCAWPTVRTRSIATRSVVWRSPSTTSRQRRLRAPNAGRDLPSRARFGRHEHRPPCPAQRRRARPGDPRHAVDDAVRPLLRPAQRHHARHHRRPAFLADGLPALRLRRLVMLPLVLRTGMGVLRTNNLRLQVARCAVHTVGTGMWFLALPLVPLAEITAISFTSPIFLQSARSFFSA